MLKKILGVILGAVTGGFLIWAVELLSQRLYPPPEGFDPLDHEQLRDFIVGLPAGAFAIVLGAYVIGCLGAGWVAGKVGRSRVPAVIVGCLFTLAGVYNVATIPHPLWFAVASIACYVPCAWIGASLAGAGRSRD